MAKKIRCAVQVLRAFAVASLLAIDGGSTAWAESRAGGLPNLADQVAALQTAAGTLQEAIGNLQAQITNLSRTLQSQITALQSVLDKEIADAKCVAGGDAAQINVCDANGACRTARFSCFPYRCDANANSCATQCATSSDCATGFGCESNVCVAQPVASCSADHLSSVNNFGGDTRSCVPYVCDTSGLCLKTCATTDDCAPGFACCASVQQCTKVC